MFERSAVATSAVETAVAWHSLDGHEIERLLETSSHGLTDAEAEARRERYGPNQLHEEPPASAWLVFVRQFRSPLIFILLVALAVTIGLGEHLDAAVIAVVLVLNSVIGFTQERKAEGAVQALMGWWSPAPGSFVTVDRARSTVGIWCPAIWCSWSPGRGSPPTCDWSERRRCRSTSRC